MNISETGSMDQVGYKLVNFATKQGVVADNLVFTSPEAPWEVVVDLDTVRARINAE